MNKSLTIIIPSYRSKNLILSHLKNFSNKYKIIIIENSYDISLKKIIKSKFKNVDVYLKKNIGYGKAVNFASKKVKTKFFFVINPDTLIYDDTLKNLIIAANKIKKFGAIGPVYKNINKRYKKEIFIEEKKIIAAAMLINTYIFKSIKGYDENYFLYYEDNDYFKKCNSLNLKIYSINNSFLTHSKSKKNKKTLQLHSTSFSNLNEKNSTYCIGGWHGQWSKFYFLKKYKGFIKALGICLPHILLNIIQLIPTLLYDQNKAKYKYYKIEGFFYSFIGLPSVKRSIFDKKNIY